MRELPQNKFFEGFYIWFDKEKKEEYYGTPLYLYNVDTKVDTEKRQVKLFLKKTKFDGLKYPGILYFPYTENFGTMLMMFLNADFSNFEKAYKTFFYAYGFELLKEYVPYKELEDTYTSEKKMLDIMKRVFEDSSYELKNDTLSIKKHNIYTSEKLSNILYVVLEQIVQAPNLPIKQCQNCGKYFIPSSRQDEVYCEFPDEKGNTCKEKGALETYKKNLENVPALLEYRRSYQKKIMIVSRNKENKQLNKDFDKWKKEAQAKIKLFKQGKLEEEKLYNWMLENK